ncbi:hypothetical protein NDU88_006402 [Pleurodeles waltl]|uniref:Uncharacterized protein n=1 Tax=Pleurodeles waltl TaxID=8319 RepID=A0AAV7LP26_PLEWA|nr:hypothetical protein NDU88_006402 [Pleurodeles waltl]
MLPEPTAGPPSIRGAHGSAEKAKATVRHPQHRRAHYSGEDGRATCRSTLQPRAHGYAEDPRANGRSSQHPRCARQRGGVLSHQVVLTAPEVPTAARRSPEPPGGPHSTRGAHGSAEEPRATRWSSQHPRCARQRGGAQSHQVVLTAPEVPTAARGSPEPPGGPHSTRGAHGSAEEPRATRWSSQHPRCARQHGGAQSHQVVLTAPEVRTAARTNSEPPVSPPGIGGAHGSAEEPRATGQSSWYRRCARQRGGAQSHRSVLLVSEVRTAARRSPEPPVSPPGIGGAHYSAEEPRANGRSSQHARRARQRGGAQSPAGPPSIRGAHYSAERDRLRRTPEEQYTSPDLFPRVTCGLRASECDLQTQPAEDRPWHWSRLTKGAAGLAPLALPLHSLERFPSLRLTALPSPYLNVSPVSDPRKQSFSFSFALKELFKCSKKDPSLPPRTPGRPAY